MKYVAAFLFSCLLLSPLLIFSQEVYQPDKAGRFILKNNLNICPGTDKAGFTAKLTALAEWLHRNDSILLHPKGFEANISLMGNPCNTAAKPGPDEYGNTCLINFSFHHFYLEKGVPTSATDWSAHDFELSINNPMGRMGVRLGERGFESGDDPKFGKLLDAANENLEKYFAASPPEKDFAPGVRLYKGNQLLIFNPDQPDFWLPVTVKAVMEALLMYYKIRKEVDTARYNKSMAELAQNGIKMPAADPNTSVYDIMLEEYKRFSPEELKSPAFRSTDDGVSGINAHGKGNQVVKFNPACWNRNLPKTAVQFISLEYKTRSPQALETFYRDNDRLKDYVGLFINALPVERLGELMLNK